MRTTLDYVQTRQLNNAASSTPGGSTEPVTGLPISTGTNSGDFVELTDFQASQLSKVTVGLLYSGVYQRVKLSTVALGGTTTPAVGQPLFWNASDTTDPYAVTNVPNFGGNQNWNFAGVVIDPSAVAGNYFWIQNSGKAVGLVNGTGAVGDIVNFPNSGATDQFGVGTTALTNGSYVGVQLTAGNGAGSLAQIGITVDPTKY